MDRTTTLPRPVSLKSGIVPPLENGDRLTRAEFERRYQATPERQKAELIEGVVYLASPVRWTRHSKPTFLLATWLGVYEANTPGTEGGDNGTVRLDMENEPQPDVFLRISPDRGGQSGTSNDDYVEGAPELVVEVAGSSASIDLHDKLDAYHRNRVREYIVWRVPDRELIWLIWREERYERLIPDTSGAIASEVFPGLWLDVAALLQGDLAKVLAVLQQGLIGPEHSAFVERLQASGSSSPKRQV